MRDTRQEPRSTDAPAARATGAARRGRGGRRTVVAVTAGVLALAVAGGGSAVALGRGGDAERYRTAVAATGTVSQTVTAAGTVTSATRRDAAFAVAGTVATVDVAVGDVVTAGQTLATLDPTDLAAAVEDAGSALADAQQRLEDDLTSQATGTAATPAAATTATTAGAGTVAATTVTAPVTVASSLLAATTETPADDATATPSTTVADARAAVTAAQDQLLAAYDALATAVAGVSDAWSGDTCTAFLAVDPETVVVADAGAGATDTGEDDGTGTDDTGTTAGAGSGTPSAAAPSAAPGAVALDDAQALLASCQTALRSAGDALADPLAALDAAGTALDAAVQDLAAAVDAAAVAGAGSGSDTGAVAGGGSGTASDPGRTGASATPGTTSAPDGAGTTSGDVGGFGVTGSTGGATGGSATGPTSGVATAATVLADRARVALREQELAVAEHEATLAALTSPVAGTVGALAIAPGDPVSASSATQVVTVLGGDLHVVEVAVPLASVDSVAVGHDARVRVGTTDADLTGTVSSVGVLDVSETTTPAYTVLVTLDPTDERVLDDASAQVDVLVAAAQDVLTVPTSALRRSGGMTSLLVLADDGTVRTAEVEVGAQGAELTEVTSGVDPGARVVLADLTATLDAGDDREGTGLSGLGSGDDTQVAGDGRRAGGPPSDRGARSGG